MLITEHKIGYYIEIYIANTHIERLRNILKISL